MKIIVLMFFLILKTSCAISQAKNNVTLNTEDIQSIYQCVLKEAIKNITEATDNNLDTSKLFISSNFIPVMPYDSNMVFDSKIYTNVKLVERKPDGTFIYPQDSSEAKNEIEYRPFYILYNYKDSVEALTTFQQTFKQDNIFFTEEDKPNINTKY